MGWARDLRGQLLYLYKGRRGEPSGQGRAVVNKVELHLLNLTLNDDF